MKNLLRATLLLPGLLWMSSHIARADDLKGNWQVKSLTTTTLTLDGKEKIKGPFTLNSEHMWLEITGSSFTYHEGEKITAYRLRKQRRGFLLTRRGDEGAISIVLTNVRRNQTRLTFTTTRNNVRRKERTVVQFACTPRRPGSHSDASLAGTRWRLVEIAYNNDKLIKPGTDDKMTLEFGESGKVFGNAGINRFNSSYTTDGSRAFSIGEIVMTRAANPPDSIADTYIKDLKSANHFLFDKGMLILQLPYDTGVMKFQRITN